MMVLSRSRVALREGVWDLRLCDALVLDVVPPAISPWASRGKPLAACVPPVLPVGAVGTVAESWAAFAALPEFCPQLPLHPSTGRGTIMTQDGVISRFARRKWPNLSKPLIPPFVK